MTDHKLTNSNMDEALLAVCTSCHCNCNLKEMGTELKTSEDLCQKAMDALLLKADAVGSVTALESHLRLLEKLVCRPWRDFNNCQEAIKQCYSIMANCRLIA